MPYEIVLATVAALLFLGAYRARRTGVTMKVRERFQVRDPQTGQLTTYGSLDEMPADIRTRIEQARAGATGESRPLRITATDASGRTRTYDSVEEMPADVRAILRARDKGAQHSRLSATHLFRSAPFYL